MKLPTDSAARKNVPIWSGVMNYFPLALAAVARLSKRGNDKHNPGEPLHWAREKSTDHKDCIARHLIDIDHFDEELQEYEEAAAVAWRALAYLQLLEEKRVESALRPEELKAFTKATLQFAAAVVEKRAEKCWEPGCVVCKAEKLPGKCIRCPAAAREQSAYCQQCWDTHVMENRPGIE